MTVKAEADAQLELDRYGIEITALRIYRWNGFRYTSARDALAAAKRAAS